MLHLHQPLEASPRAPGVVSLHVNAGYFWITATRVTSAFRGPPPSCKQAHSFRGLFFSFLLSILTYIRTP